MLSASVPKHKSKEEKKKSQSLTDIINGYGK